MWELWKKKSQSSQKAPFRVLHYQHNPRGWGVWVLSGFESASWSRSLWDTVGFLLDCKMAFSLSKVPQRLFDLLKADRGRKINHWSDSGAREGSVLWQSYRPTGGWQTSSDEYLSVLNFCFTPEIWPWSRRRKKTWAGPSKGGGSPLEIKRQLQFLMNKPSDQTLSRILLCWGSSILLLSSHQDAENTLTACFLVESDAAYEFRRWFSSIHLFNLTTEV